MSMVDADGDLSKDILYDGGSISRPATATTGADLDGDGDIDADDFFGYLDLFAAGC